MLLLQHIEQMLSVVQQFLLVLDKCTVRWPEALYSEMLISLLDACEIVFIIQQKE